MPEERYVIDPHCHQLLTITDANGYDIYTKEYGKLTDLSSGYWYLPLGAGFTPVREAARRGYPADLFINRHFSNEQLAEVLCHRLGYHKAIFLTSGSSAIDCALRIAYQATASGEGKVRPNILSLARCYHGSSSLGIGISGLGYDVWSPHPISAGLLGKWMTEPTTECAWAIQAIEQSKIDWQRCASFIFEPVQGVAGIKPVNREAYQVVAEQCRTHDVLVIADEITTGMGRGGELALSAQYPGILKPDILVLGKGLTNGEYPLSAVLISEKVSDRMEESTSNTRYKVIWGETLGGQPAGCLAALATLQIISDPAFLESIRSTGLRIAKVLTEELRNCPIVTDIRCFGMMFGIQTKHGERWPQKAVQRLWECGYRAVDEGSVLVLGPALNMPEPALNSAIEAVVNTFRMLPQ